ncbi:5'-3' exoribonuclease [Lachnellula subtilissima]|uniref:5'-3' exoribonuclease n=1 Tax=Lachnellula subtilissima TaxID=602034 RepID=A0A8H8RUM1_9HELO|nr:5'-3' exoribonuclease [Lachnellula subtilissima]
MGVPKFFRWMSERYPAISQLIAENRIPEFDCLYLDMNGIIHNCTHKDSDDATFRMTEEQMFIAIFNYIEHLYGKIKPKQLFFMAIDGVAPRAKMNQQRARRFRTALDVENAREKAIKEGKEMPKEEAFDSNSITPGTEFMHKLTQQLKYFINKKVSEDVDWQGVEIVLSGHEVPGEGEHKVMEYIRLAKAQPDYDPNVRHCLYGLDADLIMLGLLSHDPHFCLLREEVTFGRQSKTKSKELEHQNFYLMHLCIVREYLELEFQELKEDGVLGFEFDLERVIDDFILMAFFVGNDFLPNLPNLHINEGALALMFKIYKTVLPKGTGYINEGGVINMERLAVLSKQMAKEDVMVKGKTKGKITMTSPQREVWKQVKKYVTRRSDEPLNLPAALPAADRKFVQDLAESLHLEWKTIEDDQGDRHMQLSFPPKLVGDDEEDDEEDEESQLAVRRVVKQFDSAQTIDLTRAEAQAEMDRQYEEKFQEWKDKYYEGKFEWTRKNDTELTKLCENYVQGLQWVLFYYYRGVASWPWFYQYHYSPMISDVVKGLKADVNFKLGQPFHPYEQLMGVLPDRSKKIVPAVYHDLMTNPNSPIIDFYPRDFELDMNGKKMEWEAVVKIPFIEEGRLLAAMAPKNALLSEDEKFRNDFGVTLKFTHDPDISFTYPSSLVGIFPDIPNCHCVENIFDLPTIEGLEYHVGLMEGVKLGHAALAGFPSLATIPYNATLGFHSVNVFQSDSKNESMVVTIEDSENRTNVKTATMKLGQRVFVGYPFLQEGKVVKVSDELFDYFPSSDGSNQPLQQPHGPREIEDFRKKADRIENNYSKRLGIIIGPVESITHVEILKGLKKTDEGASIKEYAVIPGIETEYATQVCVDEVLSEDQRFLEKAAVPIEEEFPPGSRAFFLGEFNFGRPLEIISHKDNRAEIWLSTIKGKEVEFGRNIVNGHGSKTHYTPSFAVAKMLGLHPLVLSKITSSFTISALGLDRLNLGLNLKFEAKKLKVLGYSQRTDKGK